MKSGVPLVCLSLALAGCASARLAPLPLRTVLADYRSITAGMTEAEVVALLGSPDRIDRDGTRHWWEDRQPGSMMDHFAELDVKFDADSRVVTTKVRTGTDFNAGAGDSGAGPANPHEVVGNLFRP
ncbi:MAG TPA: hypothetical protein VG838_14960 [Opitutaceae bacterium]|nr:hypothetical protein [Opitutaceae bacterium]